jgi:hypothetical protein
VLLVLLLELLLEVPVAVWLPPRFGSLSLPQA